ncbi:ATP-binding protein [Candidatus Woesearchaeota archaeon]|nr:ATP-binding protein [Candidatus Woesearchaeota archaeon]
MVIQNFRNRERELTEISEVMESGKFELLIVYGRRRIGKTELILKATESSKRLYFLAVGERNLERFYAVCIRQFPEISRLKMDWEAAFEFLKDKVDAVVIDEFQNLIRENESILNVFQAITDTILKNSKLKLFLLGSSVSMMTSKVLDYKSPLYGRKTGALALRAVSFSDLRMFFPGMRMKELMEIYGFADGIPFYLVKVDKDFWPWLRLEIKKEKSFLRDEVDFLIRYEFEDAGTYRLILEAIANGRTKLNEIKDFIRVKRTDLSPYLKNLIEVGMIKRAVPVTENIKSRHGRYYLSDNFLRFWFRYIYPNLSSLEEGIFDVNMVKSDYSSYLGGVFEDVARQFLIKERKNIFQFTKVGKWWRKEREIDIVALDANTKQILFAECKWQEKVNAKKVLDDLKEKARHVDWNREGRKEYYAVFAKSFKESIKEDVYLFDLKYMDGK